MKIHLLYLVKKVKYKSIQAAQTHVDQGSTAFVKKKV